MDEETFNRRLKELIKEIASLPPNKQKQLALLVEETKARHKSIKESIDKITGSLTDLRICLQYLLFDIEATRRERDALKAKLKDQSSQDTDEDDGPNKADGEV